MWLCDAVQGTKLKGGERFFPVKLGGGGARECASNVRPRFEAWPHQGGAPSTLLSLVLPPLLVHTE